MNIWDFSRKYLNPYKIKGSEIVPLHCPYCKGGDKKDEETFALNSEKRTYNCKRGSCGKSGNFFQLCKDNGEKADDNNFEMYKPKKKYKKSTVEVKPATNQVIEYLALRKISKETLDLLRVGSDKTGNIVFPYYQDGEKVFVKFRPARKIQTGEKKSWRETDTKPILWGMDLCTSELPLIITEGEIDTLSLYEAGLKNIVSVPSGSEEFSWVENCWDWLQKFEKIILFGDSDAPGKEMVKKIVQKLGSYRCMIVEVTRKDANEMLYYDGKESIIEAVKNAKDIPIYGLIDLSDVEPLDIKNMKTIKYGIKALDEATGGSRLGELSVWTGRRGEGKSTLLSQIFIEAIEKDVKVCAYSGEMKAQDFQYWVNLQLAGHKNLKSFWDKYRGREVYYVDAETRNQIINWYRGKFFLYDNSISASKSEEASILKVFEYAVKKYDAKLFLVDNLMTARYEGNEKDYYLKQINFVRDLIEFASCYNVHIHLVAHPKKQIGNISNDDISGRAEITNLAHNVFSIEKTVDNKDCDVIINILKNRWEGAKDSVGLLYCKTSRRLYMPSTGALKRYGWETQEKEVKEFKLSDDCPF